MPRKRRHSTQKLKPARKATNKMTARRGPRQRVYSILDNGGTPFKVEDLGGSVVITKNADETGADTDNFVPLLRQRYRHIFPGKYPSNISRRSNLWNSSDIGNSVLLHLGANRYMYIGESIYKFNTNGDCILDYYSPIGNSAVPYPFAVGENYTYIMLDKVRYPNSVIDTNKDPYPQHYGFRDTITSEAHRALLAVQEPINTVVIQRRLW